MANPLKDTWGKAPSDRPGFVPSADRLLTMEIELSRTCNLACTYCYADSGQALDNELDLGEITNVVDQALGMGAERIIVLGGGEPLASPLLMDVLAHLRARETGIELFTNATLIDRKTAEAFFRLGVEPVIKLNSLDPEVQDALAGVPGTHAAIMAGLEHLRRAGYPAEDRPLGAQSVICAQNVDEMPSMWVWLRDRGIIPYFEMITLQGRAREHPELQVSPERTKALFEELSRLDKERYGIEWTPHPAVAAFTCDRHLYSCTVTSTGKVLPCPGVNIPVGDVRERPLADILASSPVIRDLRGIRSAIKGACKACDLAGACYGCRGMAYQTTGDYLASDPLCWRVREGLSRKAEDLIPHRRPMLVMDELLEHSEGKGVAVATVGPDWAGVDEEGMLDGAVLAELAAQAYACVMGYGIRLKGLEPKEGYLVGMRRFVINAPARSGDRLEVAVSTKGSLGGFAVVSGEVRRGGEVLASGEIKVWTPEGNGE